jgi:inorganic pyrophosphatase/exopolyphosphatase
MLVFLFVFAVSLSVGVVSFPQMRFSSFIQKIRSTFATIVPTSTTTHFVIGNEACDCDSAISALAYAFRLASSTRFSTTVQIIPVISCLRKDWPLRREANDLLIQCMKHDADFNISYPIEDDLVFLDDVVADLTKSSKNGEERKVTITLVDHNVLKGPLALALKNIGINPETSVIEIIDHHLDSGKHMHVTGIYRNIAFDSKSLSATAGSTSTLVANDLLNDAQLLSSSSILDKTMSVMSEISMTRTGIDASLAEVLGSCILLDTVGLNPSAGKATPLDFEIISRLRLLIASERKEDVSIHLDPKVVFERLNSLKQDVLFWKSLSSQQALEFDYKSFELGLSASFGTSSIMASLADFLNQWKSNTDNDIIDERFLTDISDFISTKGLLFHVLLSTVSQSEQDGGGIERSIAFIAKKNTLGVEHVTTTCAILLQDTSRKGQENIIDLKLEEVHVKYDMTRFYVRVFRQKNNKVSRKQIAPLIQSIFSFHD